MKSVVIVLHPYAVCVNICIRMQLLVLQKNLWNYFANAVKVTCHIIYVVTNIP